MGGHELGMSSVSDLLKLDLLGRRMLAQKLEDSRKT